MTQKLLQYNLHIVEAYLKYYALPFEHRISHTSKYVCLHVSFPICSDFIHPIEPQIKQKIGNICKS